MDIDNGLVDRLAELSKLEFNADEKERIKGDLQKILNYLLRNLTIQLPKVQDC